MITKFKIFETNKIYEKSTLTKHGFPHEIMVNIQKHFQIKGDPEKLPKSKKVIEEYLKNGYLIFLLYPDNCDVIYRSGYASTGTSNPVYLKINFDIDGNVKYLNREGISKVKRKISLINVEVFALKHGWSKYRKETIKPDSEIRKEKIKEFRDYFNENSNRLLSKYYSKKWNELVDSVRVYYDKITKDPKTFLNNLPDKRAFGSEEERATRYFSEMSYTLKEFAEKIESNTIYKITKDKYYDDVVDGVICKYSYRQIIRFLNELKGFEIKDIGNVIKMDNETKVNVSKILYKAIQEYGIPKLARLFARYEMNNMSNWLRNKIGKYTGMDDEIEKYNL